jgi:hypothetical protein
LRNIVAGLGIAIALAVAMLVPSIGRVSTWKIVLAAIGLVIVVLAGRDASKKSV